MKQRLKLWRQRNWITFQRKWRRSKERKTENIITLLNQIDSNEIHVNKHHENGFFNNTQWKKDPCSPKTLDVQPEKKQKLETYHSSCGTQWSCTNFYSWLWESIKDTHKFVHFCAAKIHLIHDCGRLNDRQSANWNTCLCETYRI